MKLKTNTMPIAILTVCGLPRVGHYGKQIVGKALHLSYVVMNEQERNAVLTWKL